MQLLALRPEGVVTYVEREKRRKMRDPTRITEIRRILMQLSALRPEGVVTYVEREKRRKMRKIREFHLMP